MLAEVDGPHQEYCAELEAEVTKYRDLYHRVKRDHEMLKAQVEHRTKHSDQFQGEMDKLRQAEIDDLRRQVEDLKALETESRLNDELRRLKRELTTADLRVMTLAEQVRWMHHTNVTNVACIGHVLQSYMCFDDEYTSPNELPAWLPP